MTADAEGILSSVSQTDASTCCFTVVTGLGPAANIKLISSCTSSAASFENHRRARKGSL